ncbi:hypothetical protein Drorol1_Dr00006734 [Drosera rotundifolia]
MSSAPIQSMMAESDFVSRFADLRGVRWRINLGILPSSNSSSSFDDLRRVTADSRRRYAGLRRRLLVDPHVRKDGSSSPDLSIDNPLSQNPDSMWGRYFRNAELEKMVDQDLSRLYPEHGSFFQTPGCQGMLRRVLLLWCLRHPEYGYRQGMHELLAPLLFVLHSDVQRLSEVRSRYEDYFTDKFDDAFFHESEISPNYDHTRVPDSTRANGFEGKTKKVISLEELDPSVQTIISLSDAYGAEGELGIMLSEKFLEHDAYCMFDALMSGAGGAVAMAEFFSHLPATTSQTGLPPVIEASSALYHLLSIVDSSLHSHLVELGVEPQYFALRWFRVLFGREFSLEHLLLVWDEIFSLDNSRSDQAAENELGSSCEVLNSPRGAFISAIAIAMILHVRSSLLATENATSCLQRLLNFPQSIDLNKILGKAKSLLPVALDAINSPIPYPLYLVQSQSVSKMARALSHSRSHSFSFDSSPGTPTSSMPESYWEEKWRVLQEEEEKWRVLQKEEELKKDSTPKQASSTPKKSWTQKVKLRLSRTESDPSSKRGNREKDHKSSVRRSLIEDLAQKLKLDEDDNDESKAHESVTCTDPLLAESVSGQDVQDKPVYVDHENVGRRSTSSEPLSLSGSNGIENDLEESSVASNASEEVNSVVQQNVKAESVYAAIHQNVDPESSASVESPLPISDPPDADMSFSACDSSCESTLVEPSLSDLKSHKSLSGKFHWLWKFARQHSEEGTSDRRAIHESSTPAAAEGHGSNVVEDSMEEHERSVVNVKAEGNDQKLMCTLKSLGQSMLENIQVIETVFQQDKVGSSDNPSKNILVERGQGAAVAALKELRKISNLLSEICEREREPLTNGRTKPRS